MFTLFQRLLLKAILLFTPVLYFTVFLATSSLSAQDVIWAQTAGGEGDQFGEYTTYGPQNEVVVIGRFFGTIHFGEGQANETTLTADGGYVCFFVAKYDSNGVFLWARQIDVLQKTGVPWNYQVPSCAIDAKGFIALSASYLAQVVLNKGQSDELTLSAENGSGDIFLARYSPNGKLTWAISAGGPKDEGDAFVSFDRWCNIFLYGSFSDTCFFGAPPTQTDTIFSRGDLDLFVAKYDSSGRFLWVRSGGGIYDDRITAATTDSSGNVIFTGSVSPSALFGQGEANETLLPGYGETDIFIAKYDDNGNFLWVKEAGSATYETGWDVTVDHDSNILVTGYFSRSITFDGCPDTLISSQLWSQSLFLAKFAPDGTCLWARQSYGDDHGSCEGLKVDVFDNNDPVVLAFVIFKTEFGKGTVNDTLISAIPDTGGMVMAKFSSSGDFLEAQNISDWNYSVESFFIDPSNRIVQTGYFDQTITLGSGENAIQLTSQGAKDVFLACYDRIFTNVNPLSSIPLQFELRQNFPNPFNPVTHIPFTIGRKTRVKIRIYDVRGALVDRLLDAIRVPGKYEVTWNASRFGSGVYFVRLDAGNRSQVRKIVLLK